MRRGEAAVDSDRVCHISHYRTWSSSVEFCMETSTDLVVWRGHFCPRAAPPGQFISRDQTYFSQVALGYTLCLLELAVEYAPWGRLLHHAFRHVGRSPGTRPKVAHGCPVEDFSASTYSILDSAPIRSLK